jgi:hypothetical protein
MRSSPCSDAFREFFLHHERWLPSRSRRVRTRLASGPAFVAETPPLGEIEVAVGDRALVFASARLTCFMIVS